MSRKLVVAPGRSMIHPKTRAILPPGTVIVPGEIYSKSYIEVCIKSGFIEVESVDKSAEAARERALAVLDENTVTLKVDAEIETVGAAPKPEAPVEVATHTRVSHWNLDPDGLRGKSLDDLNILVAERDPSVEPFTTVEEAIGWLSMDYSPPAVAS